MNVSLHLQTIFTFIRQNRAISKENLTHIYKNCTRHCLLCTQTQQLQLFDWKVYWKHSPCTYTYIHISRAVKLPNVANMLAAFSHGYGNSGMEYEIPTLPFLYSTCSASQQFSIWLSLGWDIWWKKTDSGIIIHQEHLCLTQLYSWAI